MYYPESESFVQDNPELRRELRRIDRYLASLVGSTADQDVMLSLLGLDPAAALQILSWYEAANVVRRVKVALCPCDRSPVVVDESGIAECDLCDEAYDLEECAVGYRIEIQDRKHKPSNSSGVFESGYALLIGIDDYPLSPLGKAVADAKSMYDVLTSSVYTRYSTSNVRLLLDRDATRSAISCELSWLAEVTNMDSTVIISFAGHGLRRVGGFDPGEYLCPVDMDLRNLASTCISTEALSTALQAIPAANLIVFLDACHSAGVGSVPHPPSGAIGQLIQSSYDNFVSSGRAIVAACRSDEYSHELPGMVNGLFTHHVLEGLRGDAGDSQGRIGAMALAKYVMENVPKRCPQQNPYLKYDGNDFWLAKPPIGRI